VSNCSEHQKWREIVSPVVTSKQCSRTHSSDSLSVTADDVYCKSFIDDNSVKNLIQSTEVNASHQDPGISGALCEEHQGAELDLMPSLVPSNDGWMYDAKILEDVLCSLLNSCHMNSTDPDNSLPLVDGDDDDARSCLSSATEVYSDLQENLKVDDVSDHCGSPQDKDSDGTVSLLSVVLDGDGLDLMDSTSDGFQNIYSSLVGTAAMDTVLSSGANELNNGTYSNSANTANLSAYAVEQNMTSLLDKEGSSAVMALDASLVKNLPCPTATVASICDKLEDGDQQPKKDDEDGLDVDVVGKPEKSVNCHCSKLHTSKKSCRSSLRMPKKLADVDPASPLLACRPPPLSVHCGKYGTDMHFTSDVAEGSENTASSFATPSGSDAETPNRVCSRKRKSSSVSDVESESSVKSSSSIAETKSHKKLPAEISVAAKKMGQKHTKHSLKSFRDGDKIQVMPGNLSKTCVVKLEKHMFRISASQVKKPINYTTSVLKRQTLSEERPTASSKSSTEQIQQTTFTLEHTQTGSTRTVILRKPTCPPMLSVGKPSASKLKLYRVSDRQQLNRSHIYRKKEKTQPNSVEKPRQWIAADDSDSKERWNKVGSETDTDEEFSLKKRILRSGQYHSTKHDESRSNNSNRVSRDNGRGISHRKSGNGNDQIVPDTARGNGSNESEGKRRKKFFLLAQLENSEGYVAARNFSPPHHDSSSLQWSDHSREENKVGSENDTDEEFALKKRILRSGRHSNSKQDQARGNNSSRVSKDNGSRVGGRKSGNRNDRSVSDTATDSGGNESDSKHKKKCSLLAQLENSEGYVAERNVLQQQQQHDSSSLLLSDTSTLSREERALQVSFDVVNQLH